MRYGDWMKEMLPMWQTSTPAVLNSPKELATVTMWPWLISSIVGRKAFVVWKSEMQSFRTDVTRFLRNPTEDRKTKFYPWNVLVPKFLKKCLTVIEKRRPFTRLVNFAPCHWHRGPITSRDRQACNTRPFEGTVPKKGKSAGWGSSPPFKW